MPARQPGRLLAALCLFCLQGHLDCEAFPFVDQKVKQGDDATLECYRLNNAPVILLKWEKLDLQPSGYVFYLKDGHLQESLQHPSFKGRARLKDEVKNGDFSVILKNVTRNDSGRYLCYTGYGKPEDTTKPVSSVNLTVEEPGQQGGLTEDGSVGLKVVLLTLLVVVVVVVVVVAAVVFVIYRRCKQQNQGL